ncbi:hypothetical protein Tco_0383439 [Tanacetum coccineum]
MIAMKGRKIADLDADAEEVEVEKVVSTVEVITVSATTTTVDELTLAQTLIEIKAAKPKAVTTAATTTTTAVTRPKARGVVVQEPKDLETLWKLVKAKHGSSRPEEAYERVLWGDLKVMFERDVESDVWRNLQGPHSVVWKLFSIKWSTFCERFRICIIFMLGLVKKVSTYTCNNHSNAQQEASR